MGQPDRADQREEPLAGLRILVVEDEFLIALQTKESLAAAGAQIIGPAATVATGLSLAESERPSCALLDYTLGHETAAPVADFLSAARIPFAFYTGQLPQPLKARWPGCEVLSKPSRPESLVAALRRLAVHHR